jgi:serine/threonine protein kinase
MKERYEELKELFQAALDLAPVERNAFLDDACQADSALRAEVAELLAAHAQTSYFDAAALPPDALEDSVLPITNTDLGVGQQLGPYRILREIGHGGMGTVYLAERADQQFKKQVALKVLRGGSAAPALHSDLIVRRFRQERQILASLEHPNIARLLDGGATPAGLPYLVLEYVEGQPLDDYCDAHQLSLRERLQLFRTVCAAVHYAHQNLVVHRDLKPSNILITPEGTPKLLDFGIAKILNPETPNQIYDQTIDQTLSSVRLMTPAYASPEQVRGETITTASDVYALGVILYELLTGHRPYQLSSPALHDTARIICEVEPPKPSAIVIRAEIITGSDGRERATITPAEVSRARKEAPEKLRRHLAGDLDNIVLMALRKEPQRRYASVEQFSEDLQRCLDRLPVRASRDTFAYRSAKFMRRHRAGVAALAIIFLLVVGSAILLAVQSARLARERDKAEQVSKFLASMFEMADPYNTGKKEVTASEILDKGAQRIAAELKDHPEAQAQLMNVMGKSYEGLGLYEKATPLMENALGIRRNQLGNEALDTAESLNDLGLLLIGKSDFARAQTLLREALQIRRKQLGTEHVQVAITLNNLGLALQEKGEYAAAEPLLREALAINRKLQGSDSAEVATNLNNLGRALHQQGKHAAAEPLYRESLAIKRRLFGDEHPKIINILLNLAWLSRDRSDYETAEALNREALAVSRKLFGNEHPQVASCLQDLAVVQRLKGDYESAEKITREALAILRKLVGNENAETVRSLSNLAYIMKRKGDYVAAEALYRETLALRRKLLGDEHMNVANDYWNLAFLLSDKHDYAAAAQNFNQAMSLYRKLEGYEHADVALCLYQLGRLSLEQHHYARAEELLQQALQLQQKTLPSDHADLTSTRLLMGQVLNKQGATAKAEPMLREVLETRRKTLPQDDPKIAAAESALGDCLTSLRHYKEAEPLLLRSYPVIKAKQGAQHPLTVEALQRVVALYEAWGRTDQAARFRQLLP